VNLASPNWLMVLWALPAIAIILAWAAGRRSRALARFASPALLPRLGAPAPSLRGPIRAICLLLAIALIAAGLARPRWSPQPREVTRAGRDLVFLVDVSRSMLATDLPPSRLERTKLWIQDLVRTLEGDRVALIAFAGAPTIKSPLTLDTAFFELALSELGPASAPRGGTNIGDAIRKALTDLWSPTEPPSATRDIILFTDGEDQDSLPVAAAQLAAQQQVRIIAIGLGSESVAAPVPASEPGSGPHQSRMDPQTLRDIAAATPGGVFLNVGTGTIDLESVYNQLIRPAAEAEFGTTEAIAWTEGFQFFLVPAFILLLAEAFIRDRSR
jgi:Ca-activated chloride channel family protein